MNILPKLQNLVRAAIVDIAAVAPQVRYFSGRVDAAVPHREPQGVHFIPPAGARGLLLSPAAEAGSCELVCAQGDIPSDELQPGEGGLHLLGTYKVFLAADGTLHLGQYSATDFVALASSVDVEIKRLDAAITRLADACTPLATYVDATATGTLETYEIATATLPGIRKGVGSSKIRCV